MTIGTRFSKALLGSCLCVALSDAADAARPLATEDTGTLGTGGRQLEFGFAYARDRAGAGMIRVAESEVGLAYGARKDLDLALAVPWRRRTAAGATAQGVGDVETSAKWRFYESGPMSFALRPAVRFASGDETDGLGAGRTRYRASFIASRVAPPWGLHAEAAYERHRNTIGERRDLWSVSVAAQRRLRARATALFEVDVATNPDTQSERAPASALVGAIYAASRAMEFDVGYRVGLSDPATDRTAIAGITMRF